MLSLSWTLFASQIDVERKIYTIILHALFPQQREIGVWSDSPVTRRMLSEIEGVHIVDETKNADIAVLGKERHARCDCPLFVTDYKLLKKTQASAIGGFFWQKGRPNIIFLRSNLQKRGIELPNSMDEYMEDEL